MIFITTSISLYESELECQFHTASGPGGQNVNKVATAVHLRFDAAHSPTLTVEVRQRLEALAGHRMTAEGVLVISAQRHRSQDRNREDATARLIELIRRAAHPPQRRRPSRPTAAVRKRRLEAKSHRGEIKRGRRSATLPEE